MPTNCQTEISATVTKAVSGLPSHGANQAPSPTAFNMPSATPHNGLRVNCQIKPMITTDNTVGIKITVRKKLRIRPPYANSAASNKPIGFCTSMCTAKKTKLFRKALQKKGAKLESENNLI